MANFALSDFRVAAPRAFTKALQDQLARLDQLLSAQEGVVRRAFAGFVSSATSEEMVRQAADLIQQGDINGALALIDSHVQVFGGILPRLFQQAAISESAALAAQISPFNPTVGISFDPTDPRAAAIMRSNQLNFVREFTNEQKLATREALAENLGAGIDLQAAARAFRDSIGLTRYQLSVVESYRKALENGDSAALGRMLRDKRFDPSVEASIDGRRPLTPDKISAMVERYRQRMLAYRAETIARTEARQVLSEGQQEAFEQTMRMASLSGDDVEQMWNTNMDGRERMTHGLLDGQTQPWGGLFQSVSGAQLRYPGDPLAPAAEVIICRCHRTFRIKLPGERTAMEAT